MDIMGMMKKAREMQAKMEEVQTELEATLVQGAAGGGVVRVQMTAKGELKNIDIDDSLLKPEEKEILGDLIVAAHAEARRHAEAAAAEKMQSVTAGLPLPPGMKLPF